jgi:hypothetical protein
MLRVTALLWVSIAIQSAAMAEDDKQDTVQVHGKSLALSCAEWKRNQDGSWSSTGPLLVGTETVTAVTLRGLKETKDLESKCGNPPSSAAAPSPSSEPTRHPRRKSHPAAPGERT